MDDEEDIHVCLRCRDTIIGLTNYVAHRRAGCSAAREGHKDDRITEGSKEKCRSNLQTNEAERSIDTSGPSDEFSVQPRTGGRQETFPENVSHNSDPGSEASSSAVTLNYASGTSRVDDGSERNRQEVSHIQDSYSVMEDYTNPMPRTHSENEIRSHNPHLKAKSHDSMSLSRRQTPAQAPFTGYSDPLLLHGQDSSNMTLFRHFDSFSDHAKIQQETETEAHNVPMSLFKVSTTSYELESQNFESRYSDFYGLQHSTQEPLLSTVSPMEQCKTKQEETAESSETAGEHTTPNLKEQATDGDGNTNVVETRESNDEFSGTNLKYSESNLSPEYKDVSGEKSELRQDDFLSSLDLRSSARVPTKRRHDEDEEEYDDEDDDDGRPPRHHTGGKWRPGSRPPPSVGGKWRPATPRSELEEDDVEVDDVEDEEFSQMPPPPTYTKGKWLPGKKITNIIKVGSSIEYHCHACKRTLKGKETYERHLNSELHFVNENKASASKSEKVPEKVIPSVSSSRPVRSKKLEAKSFLKSTIARLKSRKIVAPQERNSAPTIPKTSRADSRSLSEKLIHIKQEVKEEPQDDEDEEVMNTAASIKPKLLCPICKLSFGEAYAALHFASLAHIHNELEYRQNPSDEVDDSYRKILLHNFSAIVKTSPFHCKPCNFYCNLHEDFISHMKTHKDDPEDDELKTLYTCSSCTDEDGMLLANAIRHLQTPHHLSNARDVVLQAHQVVMSSRTAVVCPLGDGTFRYFREYRSHRRLQHQDPGFQLSDQRLLRCPQCNFRALRERQIRAHIKEAHEQTRKSDAYHCFVCGLAFVTHRQAELHRRSAEHRTTLGRQRGLSVIRTCTLCYLEVEDLPALRRHMVQEHQKDCTPCHLCGIVPPLRSDLAQHQRNCSGTPGDWTGTHKCELCNFKNDLLAHVLTHTTLAHGQRGPDDRFSCHICKTKMRFSSVKGHMLSHSNEWPHACHLCSRKFPRQRWLERHLSVVHTRNETQLSEGPALCDTCGKTFSNRWHLQRHQQEAHSHAALAPPAEADKVPSAPGSESDAAPRGSRAKKAAPPVPIPTLCDVCGVQCDSPSMLKVHRQGHKRREGDLYQCPHCNYSTGHLPHLRRHLRLHTGSTPFSCPYCTYSCNNQENLRKHMLKTKRHPGRFMYECRLCSSVEDSGIFGPEPSSSQTMVHGSQDSTDPEIPQTMAYRESHPLGPMGTREPTCFSSTEPLQPMQEDVFKSNYATEFQTHLLEKHRSHFETKEEVTSHIRSYYRPEHDTTVTTTPLPFIHKKRQRHSTKPAKRFKKENLDDPDNEHSDEGEEDVLSQIRKSLDIGDYMGEEKGSEVGAGRHDPGEGQAEGPSEVAGVHHTHEEGAAVHKQLFQVVAGGSTCDEAQGVMGARVSGPKSYLRAGTRPSILRPSHAQSSSAHIPGTGGVPAQGHASAQNQGGTAHPLRLLIQQISENAPGDAEDESTRQVILILPDKFNEQSGDVSALLPSLGLASSSADCVSIVTVQQPKDVSEGDQTQTTHLGVLSTEQPLPGDSHSSAHVPKGTPEAAVIMPGDQVVTLETQMVADAPIISSETGVPQEGSGQVLLCPEAQVHEQVLNPLHMVAEAAEALTQSNMIAAQVMENPHSTQHPGNTQPHMLSTALFESAVDIHQPGSSQLPRAPRILQQEPTLEFVDNRVVAAAGRQTKSSGGDSQPGEIIYSFTLP